MGIYVFNKYIAGIVFDRTIGVVFYVAFDLFVKASFPILPIWWSRNGMYEFENPASFEAVHIDLSMGKSWDNVLCGFAFDPTLYRIDACLLYTSRCV